MTLDAALSPRLLARYLLRFMLCLSMWGISIIAIVELASEGLLVFLACCMPIMAMNILTLAFVPPVGFLFLEAHWMIRLRSFVIGIFSRCFTRRRGPRLFFDEHAHYFVEALFQKDDATALALLDDGRVTIHTPWTRGPGGFCCQADPPSTCCAPRSLLIASVVSGRKKVARIMLRRGADINAFQEIEARQDYGAGIKRISVAGYFISTGNARALALSHRLGANMETVFLRTLGTFSKNISAVHFAIMTAHSACLQYLLDKVYQTRPVNLTVEERRALCLMARIGPPAMDLFKVLRTRKYDFSVLKRDVGDLPAVKDGMRPCQVTFADILETSVRLSEDAVFLRYVVKRLGMASAAKKMVATEDFVNTTGLYQRMVENSRGWDDSERNAAREAGVELRDEDLKNTSAWRAKRSAQRSGAPVVEKCGIALRSAARSIGLLVGTEKNARRFNDVLKSRLKVLLHKFWLAIARRGPFLRESYLKNFVEFNY